MGVSGGEDGARNGPALMVGSDLSLETSFWIHSKILLQKVKWSVWEYIKVLEQVTL